MTAIYNYYCLEDLSFTDPTLFRIVHDDGLTNFDWHSCNFLTSLDIFMRSYDYLIFLRVLFLMTITIIFIKNNYYFLI